MQQGGGSPFPGPPPSELGAPFLPAPEPAVPFSLRLPLSGNGFDELGLQAVEEHGLVGGGSPGNRWPRQETMELLKIRSDLDAAFRDATLKGPLWEEVSRKLTEQGYHRSAKKCKEKFENVYKYYKRTKEARAGRQDGKSYRFFSQLEALLSPSPSAGSVAGNAAGLPPIMTSTAAPMVNIASPSPQPVTAEAAVTAPPPLPAAAPIATPITVQPPIDAACGVSSSSNTSSYSGTESEESGVAGRKRRREGGGGEEARKDSRKIMAFFDGLIQQVMERQEAMLQRFLEAIERREQDRMIREEAWRRQEKSRITREHELAAQERAAAASRDDAIISFLQKLTGQTIPMPPPPEAPQTNIPAAEPPTSPPPSQTAQAPPPLTNTKIVSPTPEPYQLLQQPQLVQELPPPQRTVGSMEPVSSSRWPKSEVYALINLRSGMEAKYQESGPKGPLWEEISAGMRRLGYSRSAKRCKEKWENINKYFKKVKESNKKRPEDAKTCPYFHQLDALYRSKLLLSGAASYHNPPELESSPHLAIMPPPLRPNFDTSKPEDGGRFPSGFFEEGSSSASPAKKPEDIVKKLMEQPIAEPESDNMEELDDIDGIDEEDDEENGGMDFRIQYQRQRLGGSESSSGNTRESNFLAMVR